MCKLLMWPLPLLLLPLLLPLLLSLLPLLLSLPPLLPPLPPLPLLFSLQLHMVLAPSCAPCCVPLGAADSRCCAAARPGAQPPSEVSERCARTVLHACLAEQLPSGLDAPLA